MRFLADENVPLPAIRILRESGLDVQSMSELDPGSPDEQVLATARAQGQISSPLIATSANSCITAARPFLPGSSTSAYHRQMQRFPRERSSSLRSDPTR
jgi:hypothetical protein